MLGRLVAVDGSLHKAPYGGEGTGPNPTESRHAGFEVHSRDVLVLFNPGYDPATYSASNGGITADFVVGRQGISRDEVGAWTRDLEQLGRQGDYFFSLNRYLFLAEKRQPQCRRCQPPQLSPVRSGVVRICSTASSRAAPAASGCAGAGQPELPYNGHAAPTAMTETASA